MTCTNEPAVSIIVLSYNRPDMLRSALESIARQTDRSIEVVAADDCSPNLEVDAVFQDYRGCFERFEYERPERNVGVVRNLLRAVRKSSGRYVTVLCDDDELEPTFVARLRATLDDDPDRCATFCNVRIIDGLGRIDDVETTKFLERWSRVGRRTGQIDDALDATLVSRTFQPAMGAMVRKSAIDWSDFPEEAAGGWDTWLAFLCATSGSGLTFVADSLFRYRQHPGALTSRRDIGWYRGLVFIYLRFNSDERLSPIGHVVRKRLNRYYTELGMALLRRGASSEAGENFSQGRKYGDTPKVWLGSLLSRLSPSFTTGIFRLYDRQTLVAAREK